VYWQLQRFAAGSYLALAAFIFMSAAQLAVAGRWTLLRVHPMFRKRIAVHCTTCLTPPDTT
jgi:hypothetical protein